MSNGMYPAAAGERAMKIQDVILRAIDGRLKSILTGRRVGDRHFLLGWRLQHGQQAPKGAFP